MLRLLKVVVSASLIAILVWGADWATLKSHLTELDAPLASLGVIFLAAQYLVSAWKWKISLRMHEIVYSYGHLLRIVCIAFFFNNFLPTAIGGDTYRAFRTMGRAPRKAYPISAIILERLVGIAVLLFLGYLCAIYLIAKGNLLHRHWIAVAVLIYTAGLSVLLAMWWLGFHNKIVNTLRKFPRLEPLCDSLRVLGRNGNQFVKLIAASAVFQGLAIVTVAILFAAIGLPGKLIESGFIAAAAGFAGILPVSINGIGVIEGSFVAAAWQSGLPYTYAITVALFLRVFMLASSIVFGILYAIEPSAKHDVPDEMIL